MIDLYTWTTPNGYKPILMLEETGVPYGIVPVDIGKGEQFDPEFLKISPNNRIPAIVDHEPAGGGPAVSVFESGAILQYLAEKTGKFIAEDPAGRAEVLKWLFWQMGGLGPMGGQYLHFANSAPAHIPYAIDRYARETDRLYRVLDDRLDNREFVAGAYSIADMAIFPWIRTLERAQPRLAAFPNIARWFETIATRPATIRAYEKGKAVNTAPTVAKKSEDLLFGRKTHQRADKGAQSRAA